MSTRALRSEYQPLVSQEDESDVADDRRASSSNPSSFHPQSRRALRPGSIDLTKLDNAFKRSALLNDPLSLVATAKPFFTQGGQNLLPRKSNARRRHQTIPGNSSGAASSNRRSLVRPLHIYVYITMHSVKYLMGISCL
jgi:hypothetical protein